ncbi:uncharacterized protein LOC143736443 [Siphateles boraxobius]|uniref:uncharacterized protein LOC143736443 n=1 Tax=Siphateles boraxobius TaxID=180520 RepID=UPI0040647C86
MSLQYYLRLPLVCLILSVVGCFPELSVGDITENDPKIKKQALENFRSVNPAIKNSVRRTLQRNVKQFNNQDPLPRTNSSLNSRRNYDNAKNPSFSPTKARAPADVIYYRSVPNTLSNVNSRHNPVELSSIKYDDEIDAKRSYAFQTVQREQNPLYFTGNQKSSNDINLAPWLMREGLRNEMHAANDYRSGSFDYQHISKSKSEMYSDSSRPLGLNEPYLRENVSAQPIIRPAHAKRVPANYMSGSSTVKHDMRHRSDGNVLFDNLLQHNGQNQKVLREFVPSSPSLSIVRANQQASKSLPRDFYAGAEATSYENMRDVSLSKVFKPPAVQTPITPVIKMSNSNRGKNFLPLIKAKMFSSQHFPVKQSNSERVASPKENPPSSFEYGNTKSAMSGYTFKDIQLTPTQNGYQNRGQSSLSSTPIQMFHSQKKYDNLATGMSAIRPSVTNGARPYKESLSDDNSGIRRPMSAISNQSKQGTHLTPRMHFAKNTLLSEHDIHLNLPDSTYNSLQKPSQHNVRNRADVNSSGQSTVQSLVTKNYPVPSLAPGYTMKNVHSVSPFVSGTQGTSEYSGISSSRTRPYYLTSKKPFAFRGFIFAPTLHTTLQKTEMHSVQKSFINSLSNVRHAPAHSRNALSALAHKPLMPNSYEKTLFQIKDIEASQKKQPDSFDNGPQRETVSSTEAASNAKSDAPKHHTVIGQALVKKVIGTNSSAGLVTIMEHPKIGYDGSKLDEVQSKTSRNWISSRFTSAQSTQAQTESNQGEMPTMRSSNGRFVGPDTYSASMKFSNSHWNPTSEPVFPILKSSLINKMNGSPQMGNVVIQPLHRYNFKEHEGLVNPTRKGTKDRNSVGVAQTKISELLRPTSSVVTGRKIEVTQEGKRSGENSSKNIYAIPSSQSAIYRAADISSHKTNSSSIIYRPANKHHSKANIQQANVTSAWTNETTPISKTDLDLTAIGVSQASSPTSSFVVGRYVNTFNKVSAKSNLKSSTKTGLNNYKPVRFSDIAGSAFFTKLHSAVSKAKEEGDLVSDLNASNSTQLMEEIFKELLFDTTIGNSSMTLALQNETDESELDLSGLELMTTAAMDITTQSKLPLDITTQSQLPIDITTGPQLSFTEDYTLPQPTVYSSEPPLDHTPSTAEAAVIDRLQCDVFLFSKKESNTGLEDMRDTSVKRAEKGRRKRDRHLSTNAWGKEGGETNEEQGG